MNVNKLAAPVAVASPGTVTVTAASPAVVSKTAHGLLAGTPLQFTTSGVLPAGISLLTTYYVSALGLTANTFQIEDANGNLIATTTTGTGTHTATCTNEVLTVDCKQADWIGIEVKNNGGTALNLFDVYGKFSPAGAQNRLLNLAADYTTPVFPCVRASASPVTLAAGATAWMFLDVRGLDSIVIKATIATTAGTLDFRVSAKSALGA